MKGKLPAAIFNKRGDMKGKLPAAVFNERGDMKGKLPSAVFNKRGDMKGKLPAAVFNKRGDMKGNLPAAVFNERGQTSVMLSIVIITRDTKDLLQQLVRSIEHDRSLKAFLQETVVIDNASADGTGDMIGSEFPWTIYIRNDRNMGFAASANQGIDRSTGKYALLLNSDTILIEGEITKMLAFMEEHEDVGICGPQLVYPDMRPQRSSASIPSLTTEVLPFLAPRPSLLAPRPTPTASGIDNRSSIIDHRMSGDLPNAARLTPHEDSHSPLSALSPQPSVSDVPSIIGAAMMIRKSLFKALSGFDEQFFFFLEETDLCLRTTQQSAVSRQQAAISDQQAVSIIDNRSSIIDETSSPPPDSPDQHRVSSIQYRVSSDQHPASSIQHQVSIIGNRQSAIDETSSFPRDADGSSNVEPPIESFEGRHGTLNVEPSSHPSALRPPPEVSPRTPRTSHLDPRPLRVVLLPDVRVIHLQGKTVGKNWIKGRIEYNISLYKFIKKHHSPLYYRTFQTVRFLKSSIVILALSLLPFLLVGKSTRRRYIYYWKVLLWHLTACPPTSGLRPPA